MVRTVMWVGVCVLGLAANARAASGAPAAAPAVDARRGSVFVDPLGFALFGPTLGVEFGSDRLSGTAFARWLNVGLLARSLFLSGEDEFGFSFGGGLRGRCYFGEAALSGPHLGVAVEVIRTRIEDPVNRVATQSLYLVPQAEGGYRLAFGRLYADAAAGVGYAARLAGSVENLEGGTNAAAFQANDESTVYATASLDLGIFF